MSTKVSKPTLSDRNRLPIDQEIQSTTVKAEPPRNRISNNLQARAIFDRLKDDQEPIAFQRARIQGQLDGNPPVREAERRRLGLSWMSNVNFRENYAIVRGNSAAIWDMLNSVDTYIELEPNHEPDPQDPISQHSEVIEQEFTRTLQNWDNFDYMVTFRILEMLKFGNGPVFWKNEWDWRSESIKTSNLLMGPKVKSSIGNLDFCIIRDEMEVGELFDAIEDEEIAAEQGWNLREVKRVIVETFQGKLKNTEETYISSQFESIQQEIKNKDDITDRQFDGVRILHILVEEKDAERRVTHLMLPEDQTDANFIFESDRRFDSMEKTVHFMMFNIGDGFLASVRGLAHELFATTDISNRLMNSTVDGAIIGSGLVLQPNDGKSHDQTTIMRKGGFTMVPEGLNALQSSFAPPLENLLQVRRVLQLLENNNSGAFKQRIEQTGVPERSATQVEIERRNEARFENIQAQWYYTQWETWLDETFRRLINPEYPVLEPGWDEAHEFRERCLRRGVPERLLQYDQWHLRAKRAIGMGSPDEKLRLTQWLINMSPLFDEQGKLNAKRDAVGARFGYHMVDRYAPGRSRDLLPSTQRGIAQLENNDFLEAKQVQPGSDQPHSVHLRVHFELITQKVKAFRENPAQVNLEQVVPCLAVALDHSAMHIAMLAQDPTRKGMVKQFEAFVKEAIKVLQLMAAQLQANRRREAELQQARQQEFGRLRRRNIESEVELERIAAQERVEKLKAQQLNEARVAKTRTAEVLKTVKTEADISREDQKAEAEIAREDAKARIFPQGRRPR